MSAAEEQSARSAERTPPAPAAHPAGVWTVALDPEFGVGAPLSLVTAARVFGMGVVTVVVGAMIALVVAIATGARPTTILPALGALALVVLLVGGVRLGRAARRWKEESTRAGVERELARLGLRLEQHAHARARGAVRSVWRPFHRPRWERLRDAAAEFDLQPPRSVVIDPTDRFKELPRLVPPDLLEPVDVGGAPGSAVIRARLFSGATLLLALLALNALAPGLLGMGRPRPPQMVFLGVLAASWVVFVFGPARHAWLFGMAETVVAAPSLVVARSTRRTRVFRASDSVLALTRAGSRSVDTVATLTRDDGARITLRFAGPEDERLRALWTMWNHPRVSAWDGASETIAPDPG